MLLVITTNDLGIIWLGVEATTVTSALLVALEKRRTSIEASLEIYTDCFCWPFDISLRSHLGVLFAGNSGDF